MDTSVLQHFRLFDPARLTYEDDVFIDEDQVDSLKVHYFIFNI